MVSLSQRNGFAELPEGCIANILSWTTPKDASRACAVYPLLRAAAESDTVWKRMLPSDWQAIIARSVTPLNFSSLKHLYLSLFDNPILIDGATKSFFLDKLSGKKCYLLSARELSILWGNGDTPQYWNWISLPEESRFPEGAELRFVWWFDISGRMSTSMLSLKRRKQTMLLTLCSKGLKEPMDLMTLLQGLQLELLEVVKFINKLLVWASLSWSQTSKTRLYLRRRSMLLIPSREKMDG
ncbi:F-box protein PP2-B1-like isoform X2 [Quercus lobata]|uniref:F-box protein PP2-B1-like isoform X2 n=1 Tax=Quercus lobata TaxID=97700 RepID=UPI0012486FE2|nr:F-box protein PP2-B1-like isoform X2 [Quercus lobata]